MLVAITPQNVQNAVITRRYVRKCFWKFVKICSKTKKKTKTKIKQSNEIPRFSQTRKAAEFANPTIKK